MDFLVLSSCEHSGDSNQMKVLDLKSALGAPEVSIHEVDTPEEGFLAHLVGGEHLDHPVHHLGAEGASDCVIGEDVVVIWRGGA